MSQSSSDKYVYFTIGVLKDSQTLEALRQDAIKHHMVDYPGQLIALRLAEHYELMHNVTIQPVVRVPMEADEKEKSIHSTAPHPIHLTPAPPVTPMASMPNNSSARSFMPTPTNQVQHIPNSNNPFMSQSTGRMRSLRTENEIISTSPNADQNADEAADYWNAL